MARIRRVVLDVLKPHDPSITELATAVADCDGVSGTNASLVEIDQEVQNLKVTVEGEDVDLEAVKEAVTRLGGSIHSVDEVACGDSLVEAGETPQD